MKTRTIHRKTRRIAAAALSVLALPCALSAGQAGSSPVKIFVLAGQSNMQGKGEISPVTTPGTLDYTVANDPDGKYQFLKSGGSYVVRDDVWIRDEDGNAGGLTTGYGAAASQIGPELGFGHLMGDLNENQILIVKCAWGGKDLAFNFCPPSSRVGEPEPVVSTNKGFYYKEILRLVDEASTNLATYFPDYNGGGYEIAGMCWHQGWNDRINTAKSAAYETNMVNFINDIRNDLGASNMPFVIATSAMDNEFHYTQVELAQLAMADTTSYPAFDGNVAVIDTRTAYNGMTFMQLVSESPSAEGYHWNKNAKTYVHIGLAMGDAMSMMASGRCPYRLGAAGSPAGVTLDWVNGTETPTSVRVLRDGIELAAAAPVSPPTFLDAAAEPGLHAYEFQFTMPGDPCPPLTNVFNGGITELDAYRLQDNVKLTWANNLGYTGIVVRRDGNIIATPAGTNTSYSDTTPPVSGDVTYSVVPANGSAAPAEATVNMDGLSPGNAYIYEAFADGDSSLRENVAGAGLRGRWSGGQSVTNGSLSFGALAASGNRATSSGGDVNSGVLLRSDLGEAGLLDHGGELWFSFLMNCNANVNAAMYLLLGTSKASFFGGMADGGQGIGVSIWRGSQPRAATWAPGRTEGSSSGQITANTTGLVVGKITWGANDVSADTVEIYQPGTDLAMPASPVSTRSAVLDQSQFDVLTIGIKGEGSIDEIRFGTSYDSVVVTGGSPASDYDVWAATFLPADIGFPEDDFDQDGMTNDGEWLFGLDPTNSASVKPVSIPPGAGLGTFIYTRRNPALSGASFSYEYSTALLTGSWTGFTPAAETPSGASPVETVTVTLGASVMTNPVLSVRVVATPPAP